MCLGSVLVGSLGEVLDWRDDPLGRAREDNDIYAAVVSPPVLVGVRGERAILSVSGRRKPLRIKVILLDQETRDRRSPGCGALPGRGEQGAVDRNLVRVPLYSQLIGKRLQPAGDSFDDRQRRGLVH